MQLFSKYPGTCTKCNGRIRVGDRIEYIREPKRVEHVECPEVAEVQVRVDAATLRAELVAVETEIAQLHATLGDLRKSYYADQKASYLAQDGSCASCGGSHSVCTFFTLDGSGYSTFGECDACKGTSIPGYAAFKWGQDMYGATGYSSKTLRPDSEFDPARYAEIQALTERGSELYDRKIELDDILTPGRGDEVRVVKGRKVPIGTVGKYFWSGYDRFGTHKVGIVDAEGRKHYTASANIELEATFRWE